MTAARTKRTKTTVKAGPAAQWRGRVEAATGPPSALQAAQRWGRAMRLIHAGKPRARRPFGGAKS